MALKKKARGRAKKAVGPSKAKLKRHSREKARRQRQLRAKPPGAKEKFISGCMAVGIAGAIFFIAALTWTCIFAG